MFALRLYEKTARRIAGVYGAGLNKGLPLKLGSDGRLLWGYDWVEEGKSGGMWVLVTQSRWDAASLFAMEGQAGTRAVNADAVFALWLKPETAQRIASKLHVRLNKDNPAEIGENTALLWAFDWAETHKPGGYWLLLTQSREDAACLLGMKKAADPQLVGQVTTKESIGSVKANEVIALNWTGPFVMLPQPETRLPYALGRDGCAGTGIYLLTVECEAGYRVNYVGETGTSIQGRLQAHYDESSKGKEGKAAEPEKFRQGIREIHRFDRLDFQADRARWSSWIDGNYRAYRVFVATGEKNQGLANEQIRKDVEAAIIRTLFSEGGDIAAFLYHPNQTKYFNRRSPTPLWIQFPGSPNFHGLAGKRIDC